MESSKVISTDKATVIIQVNSQVAKDTLICDGQQARVAYHNTALKGFLKAQPKALGAVQIMTGVTVFLFGIIRTTDVYNFPAVALFSGITYWGSLVNISAGSLTVAAQNKLHSCVVKASLVMNVLSSITAGLAILLIGMELGLGSETSKYRSCFYGYVRTEDQMCSFFERYDLGILGILLVFSILQFIISIFISAFACKATSNTDTAILNVALIGDTESQYGDPTI
ncbi:membrane-spanning 4-domains subfamily A member 4A-like [Cyprinus carpio]|uniref:Membrane-spanning 4-domains subfamily A member 4A-like n=1 Tax=Cyprinus carpio TaxID=7962 RepID=A0A9R0AUW6_CYPCA|nr:membrane-spanning 4-domains subfamily A member 4A-like [Cyprinus carpio]